jgi:D-3-phosphoglycerate dehydrogenase
MNSLIKNPLRLLIVDDLHPVFMEIVQAAGVECDYRPTISREETLPIIKDYNGLIVRSKFQVDEEMIDAAPNLEVIGRSGSGIDNIDEAYAEKRAIHLLSAAEGNCDAMAEHMMGILLGLLNKIVVGNDEVRNGLWQREKNRGNELGGKTVGLIGYGHNGQAMAKKLSGFDVEVLAYDKYKSGFSDVYAREVQMDEMFSKADILSLHVPLTSETKNLINIEFLSRFKKQILFLNGSRGPIANVDDVIEGLENKKIVAAGFDVLPKEKFPALYDTSWYKKLITFDNVILTPHVAGWSVESYFKLSKVLADKIVKLV